MTGIQDAAPPPVRRRAKAHWQALSGAADQGVSSATNLAAVMVVAIALDAEGFGAFSVAYTIYMLLSGAVQFVVGQEITLLTGDEQVRRKLARDSLLFALTLGVLLGIPTVVAGVLVPDLRALFFVLGIALPGLFLQDALRFFFAALNRMELALLCDLTWLIISAGVLLAGQVWDVSPSPSAFFACWAAGGCTSGLLFLVFIRTPGSGRPRLKRFLTRSFLGYRFLWEFIATRGTAQFLTLALGWMAGIQATGSVRGVTALFGPIGVAIMAANSFAPPILRSVSSVSREKVLLLATLALSVGTSLVSFGLYVIPPELGENLLGDTWVGAQALILPMAVQTVLLAMSTSVFLALRIVRPTSTLKLRIYGSLVVVPAFFFGYWAGGVTGAVWGLALSNGFQLLIGLGAYLSLRRLGKGLQSSP